MSTRHVRKIFKTAKTAAFAVLSFVMPKRLITLIISGKSDQYNNISCLYAVMKHDSRVRLIKDKPGDLREVLKNYFILARSAVLAVDTSTHYISQLPIATNTKVVYIGHGGGVYKKMAFSTINKGSSPEELHRVARVNGKYDFCICTSNQCIEYVAFNYNIDKSKVKPLGLPRTDFLYDIDIDECRKKFFYKYPDASNKKIILYSPTFRTVNGKRFTPILLDDINTSNEFCILFRGHPTVPPIALPKNWIDVSAWSQNEVLAISDALISDYSSIIFDFAFFRRPIYLFAPDWEEYQKKERELWFSPQDMVGDQFCTDCQTLITKLKAGTDANLWNRFMSACDGHSSKKIAQFLFRVLGDNE